MRLAALLARKDLLQTARDRLSFIFILVMPLAFTLFFGILFGANSGTQKLPLAVCGRGRRRCGEGAGRRPRQVRRGAHCGRGRRGPRAGDRRRQGRRRARRSPPATVEAVADGKQARLTIVSTQGSSGAATAASEIRTPRRASR